MIRNKILIRTFISFVLPLLLSSCGTAEKNPTDLLTINTITDTAHNQEYSIHVGDQLDVKFFYNPDLNEQVTVRPDGRISLQLVHEIMAAGLTPRELMDLLTQKYSVEIEKPEITVIVRSFSAQKVYVDGEVNKPGALDLLGSMTVLQSISRAGGLKDTARIYEIIVIRRKADNKPIVFQVNLSKIIDATDMRQDVLLKPYDIVYVPKSPIANLNQFIDQYIRKNIPIPLSLGYDIN